VVLTVTVSPTRHKPFSLFTVPKPKKMVKNKRNNFFNKKKTWVAVKTKESEKEKEKEIEIEEEEVEKQSLVMEEEKQEEKKKKKKVYSPLPSNYVTLAQLQERWLKQQSEKNQQGKKEDHQPLVERRVAVVAETSVTVSRSNPVDRNREDSVDNRRAVHVAVANEDGGKSVTEAGSADDRNRRGNRGDSKSGESRKSVTGAGIREGKADNVTDSRFIAVGRNRRGVVVVSEENRKPVTGDGNTGNVTVSRSNRSGRNRRGNLEGLAENRRAIGVENEARRKSVTGAAIGVVNAGNVTVSRSNNVDRNHRGNGEGLVENRRENGKEDGIGVDVDGKVEESQKKKKKKINQKVKRRQNKKAKEKEERRAIEESSAAKEDEEVELKDEEIVDSKTVDEVEEKFRVLSVKSENGKQNWKFRKMNHGNGHRNFKEQQSSMTWVKKDGTVGEIET